MDDFNTQAETPELIYDLRQYYAKIVGEFMVDVASARRSKKYPDYLEALRNLYDEVDMKFSKEDRIDYKVKLKKVYEIIEQHEGAYTGVNSEPAERNIVEEAIRQLDRLLKRKMNKAKIFGAKRDFGGLM